MTLTLLCLSLLSSPLPADTSLRACAHAPAVLQAHEAHDVSVPLLLSVGVQESQWKPWVVGGSGEIGAMQILPEYSRLSGQELRTPAAVVEGARMLVIWRRHGEGSWRLALQGYNGGFPGQAGRGKVGKRAKEYAQEVLTRASMLRRYISRG